MDNKQKLTLLDNYSKYIAREMDKTRDSFTLDIEKLNELRLELMRVREMQKECSTA